MSVAFRSVQPAAESRWHALLEADLDPSLRALRGVLAARAARVAGGAFGAVAGLALFVLALVRLVSEGRMASHPTHLSSLLASAIAVALGAWLLGKLLFPAAFRAAFSALPRAPSSPAHALAALELDHPMRVAERALARVEPWSVGLPLVALALLAPLGLHMLVVAAVSGGSIEADFDQWIGLSVAIVGHAHLALAVHGALWARRLARTPRHLLGTVPGWLVGWGAAVLASALPGMILYLVPPILTAVTGLAFVPAAYLLLRRALVRERSVIAMAQVEAFGG